MALARQERRGLCQLCPLASPLAFLLHFAAASGGAQKLRLARGCGAQTAGGSAAIHAHALQRRAAAAAKRRQTRAVFAAHTREKLPSSTTHSLTALPGRGAADVARQASPSAAPYLCSGGVTWRSRASCRSLTLKHSLSRLYSASLAPRCCRALCCCHTPRRSARFFTTLHTLLPPTLRMHLPAPAFFPLCLHYAPGSKTPASAACAGLFFRLRHRRRRRAAAARVWV